MRVPAKNEPVKAQPAKAQPAKAQPAKAQPVKAQPVKAQPVKAQPAKALVVVCGALVSECLSTGLGKHVNRNCSQNRTTRWLKGAPQ